MVGHDTLSETAEVLVNDEGLAIRSLLKVQSFPFGNIGGAAYMLSFQKNSFNEFSLAYMQRSLMAMR
uniref:Uncharacterized protein n=1 Tax=viral metagenome TaxID=1070528 RepID=A0A6C0D3E6_9ZZZZ